MDLTISKEEIVQLALRYISAEEITSFPEKGDFFAMCCRDITEDKSIKEDEKKWIFLFYGLCLGYIIDEQEKIYGKWIFMHFLNFGTFPPQVETLKLQPPHIVKGKFQNPERTKEFYFFKIPIKGELDNWEEIKEKGEEKETTKRVKKLDNIVEFKRKRK